MVGLRMYQALSAVREGDTERTKRRASPGRWQPEGSGCSLNLILIMHIYFSNTIRYPQLDWHV